MCTFSKKWKCENCDSWSKKVMQHMEKSRHSACDCENISSSSLWINILEGGRGATVGSTRTLVWWPDMVSCMRSFTAIKIGDQRFGEHRTQSSSKHVMDHDLTQPGVSSLINAFSVEGSLTQDNIDPWLLFSGSKVICHQQLMGQFCAPGKGQEVFWRKWTLQITLDITDLCNIL